MNITLKQARTMRKILLETSPDLIKNWEEILKEKDSSKNTEENNSSDSEYNRI